jgi:potassium efflux system protein
MVQNHEKDQKINQLKFEVINQKIARAKLRLIFSEEQLQEQILGIDRHAQELADMLERAQAKKNLQYARWAKAKDELDTQLLHPEEKPKKEQEVQTWKALSDTRRLEVEVLTGRLKRLDDLKKVWQRRFSVFNNIGRENLRTQLEESKRVIKSLKHEKQLLTVHRINVGNNTLLLEQKLKEARDALEITWFIEMQRTALQNQTEYLDHDLKSIQMLQLSYKELQIEIKERLHYMGFKERLAEVQAVLSNVWDYELTSLDDFPLTTAKIITAFFFLIAGYFVSRYLTAKAGKQIKRRFNLDEAAAIAIQTIAHYCLLVMLVLFVLNMVRIPLTFFTVIGGALVIGVGFGSQNIVNNFLSGLILMVERPVKIGDVVEVEGRQGTVEMIGARSARIKTFDNLRLVVPNSTLLQNPVINWSLADDIVRREIIVGVQYGSPVELVEKLLGQVVSEHPLVEGEPKPIILFYDFGDNALIFKILLWIRMFKTQLKNLKILQVESQIRFRIDAMFRENNIVIAYPQRDVHLDAAKPLMIKIDQSGE